MSSVNLLLLCGGGSDEHDISLMSANYLESSLVNNPRFNLQKVVLDANGHYLSQDGRECEITNQKQLRFNNGEAWGIDYVIPCIHGYPGETGDIQSFFDLIHLPYFGCNSEANLNCFNKITAKMWFTTLGIPNTPYLFLTELTNTEIEKARKALVSWGSIFIKAASQGSSVGCYKVDNENDLVECLTKAFEFSPYVVVEKTIIARELEVAAYEYQGKIVATKPGEIICDANSFYSFEEKYASSSKATTKVEANNIDEAIVKQIQEYAVRAFKGMKLKDLSRIDFFLTEDNQILLNEINTFPGMTPISMFPKMLINNGHDFEQYLQDNILQQLSKV